MNLSIWREREREREINLYQCHKLEYMRFGLEYILVVLFFNDACE